MYARLMAVPHAVRTQLLVELPSDAFFYPQRIWIGFCSSALMLYDKRGIIAAGIITTVHHPCSPSCQIRIMSIYSRHGLDFCMQLSTYAVCPMSVLDRIFNPIKQIIGLCAPDEGYQNAAVTATELDTPSIDLLINQGSRLG